MDRRNQGFPDWCELRSFDILDLIEGQEISQQRREGKERLIGTAGTTQLILPAGSVVLKESQFYELSADRWRLRGCSTISQVVRLSGRWGADLGGCGIFRVVRQDYPVNLGDPVTYPKTTSVDVHYHDCDEYWIMLEGEGTAAIGERQIPVRPGDCVTIGMGHHHDFPLVDAPVKAVFFETTLEGARRVGHLWNHTHGPAQPRPERV
jgi:mannose-6-phosphate isomerase-like protein (cupin superfamily)